jgi:hypothetical protein
VNSTQSQRIRNLETEISRLLAENIALREQAINAQAEAERWRSANSTTSEVAEMKERLQQKIQEVSVLLQEMGDIPAKAARKGRRRSRQLEEGSAEQDWRNRQSMRETAESSSEGRLPAIHEDKLYPRRTLENAELVALRDQEALVQEASESPELGPPPVAHFDVADPIAFDSERALGSDHKAADEGLSLHPAVEKRRKRRTSALLQDMPTEEEPHPPSERPAVPQLLKSGAKRKLDVSELEEPVVVQQQPSGDGDGFVFQRRQDLWNNATAGGKKASRFTRPPGRENETVSQSPQKAGVADRKILAPKSTNSPAKRKVNVSDKPDQKDRDERQRPTTTNSSRRSHLPPLPMPPPPDAAELQRQNDLPPKTPAVLNDDILSPVSTEPSVHTTHQAKEAAVLSSVEDVLNGSIGRGSRRARPAVSYALPNLRDKMRRPTKELVGAVEGIEKQRGASEDRARSEGPNTAEDRAKMDFKREKDANGDVRWKELPLSMSGKKEEPTSPLKDKERKERDGDNKPQTKIDKDRGRNYSDELEKAVDQLSIFDGPVSSPMEEPTKKDEIRASTGPTATKRRASASASARRHSTQPSSSSASSNALATTSAESVTDHPSTTSSTSGSHSRIQLARPSSVASMRHALASSGSSKDLKRPSSVSSSLRAASIESSLSGSTTAGMSTATTGTERTSERTSNRRRSMMV